MRVLVAAGALLLALVGGCGSSKETGDARLTVYLSAPLTGSAADEGKAVVIGARNALAAADERAGGVRVEVKTLDVADGEAPWSPANAAANARSAVQDSTSIAYLGELESGATRTSLPVTNDAEILQIAPGSPGPGLVSPFEGSDDVPEEVQTTGIRTFGRVAEEADQARIGRQAMAVALDAIERADDPLSRSSVIEAFFAPGEHESIAGTYTVDEIGEIEFE